MEHLRQCSNRQQAYVLLAAFQRADGIAMGVGKLREPFLRQPAFTPQRQRASSKALMFTRHKGKMPPSRVPLAYAATGLGGLVLNRREVLPNLNAYGFKRHSLAMCRIRITFD